MHRGQEGPYSTPLGGPVCTPIDSPERIQRIKSRHIVAIEQPRDTGALFVIEAGHEAPPQPDLGALANSADQTFQDGDPGQQHLASDKPRRRLFDQQTGAVLAAPAREQRTRHTTRGEPPSFVKLGCQAKSVGISYTPEAATLGMRGPILG